MSSSSSSPRRRRTTDDMLHWRRAEVVKLLSKGLTIDKTAEVLKVSPKTVQRDHLYIRQHSTQVLRNYFVDTLPNEILKNIARLTAVSDSAWSMAARAKENRNDRLEADALRLAKDTAKDITEIVTNNKSLIDAAYDATRVRRAELDLSELKIKEHVTPAEGEEEEQEVEDDGEEIEGEEEDELLREDSESAVESEDPNRVF